MTDVFASATDDVLALLRSALAGPPEVTVYDAEVPSHTAAVPLPKRYVVLYAIAPQRSHEDLAHTSDTRRNLWQVTCVGSTRPEVEWLRDKVAVALVDHVLGPRYTPLEHVDSQPTRPDDDVPGRVVLFGTDQFACISTTS